MLCIVTSGGLVTGTGICYVMHSHVRQSRYGDRNMLCCAQSRQVVSLRGQEYVMLCIVTSGSLITETGICYVMHSYVRQSHYRDRNMLCYAQSRQVVSLQRQEHVMSCIVSLRRQETNNREVIRAYTSSNIWLKLAYGKPQKQTNKQ